MDTPNNVDEIFMRSAIIEAQKAFDRGEVPIGAVIVCGGLVVGRGHNLVECLNDVTAHAEIQAITAATQTIGGKYLSGCTLYVTVEPCIMCAGACGWSQIDRVVYGASDPKRGFSTVKGNIFHPKTVVLSGILENECSELMNIFFKKLRR